MGVLASRSVPVVLCILDGWGHRAESAGNAIAQACTPTWDRLLAACPQSFLTTSGDAVGLPKGHMGNSEVGHMTIGCGRVVVQNLTHVNAAVDNGELAASPALAAFIESVKAAGGDVHLLGLVSPGGVHCHQAHMVALAKIAAQCGVKVVVHAFMDGRDVAPGSGLGCLQRFLRDVGDLEQLSVATVSGRYYAMDRDQRWERVRQAYDAIVSGQGVSAADAPGAVGAAYDAGVGDEFVVPTVIGGYGGLRNGDGIMMANFRADRARQITQAILDSDFDGFQRSKTVTLSAAVGLTEYSTDHQRWMAPLFLSESPANVLGKVVSDAGMRQLRVAESEKYAHVTFFLNGGVETVYPGETRILVPSPDVPTYDLKPEMSAPKVTDHVVRAIDEGNVGLIVVNYANGDMVGHTGVMAAAVKAAEAVDAALARLEAAVKNAGGVMLVTADHGNAEMMIDPQTGDPHTQHTVGDVRCILVNGPPQAVLADGDLADIAPSVLTLMGLPIPAEMTGRSLISRCGHHAGTQ